MRQIAIAAAALIGATCAGAVQVSHAQTYKQIYSFRRGLHGGATSAGLTAFKGKLFGVTFNGGTGACRGGCGTVFSLEPTTGKKKVIYSFQGNGDGGEPIYGLTAIGSLLYGLTNYYNATSPATIFSVDPSTGIKTIVHSFMGGSDGLTPSSSLIDSGGVLYGETYNGGSNSAGTVFAIDLATGAERVIYAFQGGPIDGGTPTGGVIDVNGTLYGTTAFGGDPTSGGTVFSVDSATGAEAVLHAFQGLRLHLNKDGYEPRCSLTKVGDRLYGTTTSGGANRNGTIFWVEPATDAFHLVYTFAASPNDAAGPSNGLIDLSGVLYGTAGGGMGFGTIFSVDVATEAEAVVYSFTGGTDGQDTNGNLIDVHGILYGTTLRGGAASQGTAFSLTP